MHIYSKIEGSSTKYYLHDLCLAHAKSSKEISSAAVLTDRIGEGGVLLITGLRFSALLRLPPGFIHKPVATPA